MRGELGAHCNWPRTCDANSRTVAPNSHADRPIAPHGTSSHGSRNNGGVELAGFLVVTKKSFAMVLHDWGAG